MNFEENYKVWLESAAIDEATKEELKTLTDKKEIEDRFYKNLEFGTGGLRGKIAAGTNRMNVYTVGKATQGLANYINKKFKNPHVAIAYDSRIKSDIFAKESARVLAANNIKVYIYKELMPTPSLSFAVRQLKCSAGIVVTASHNPSEYNGYKVYGSDGCQMTIDSANAVFSEINKLDIFDDVSRMDFNEAVKLGLINFISNDVFEGFINEVSSQSINKNIKNKDNLKVVYTPLNGSGLKCVTTVLKRNGYSNIHVVSTQEKPDGNFTTCPYPNPEVKEALEEGLKVCNETNADILLATDPDCDRVGIAVRSNREYSLLTGNEVGVLLFDYICKSRIKNGTMPKNPICIKTIVTTDMIYPIAKKYGVDVIEVLTGFKFIGEQIGLLEKKNEDYRYIFGFEESYGYLSGSYVRDKDGVNASLLICEMASYYLNEGLTLIDVLNKLYSEFGYYKNTMKSFTFLGQSGFEKMQNIMKDLRNNPPSSFIGNSVISVFDYLSGKRVFKDSSVEILTLPSSDVIKFELCDNMSLVIRPSGTEPKLKTYISVVSSDRNKSIDLSDKFSKYFENLFSSK